MLAGKDINVLDDEEEAFFRQCVVAGLNFNKLVPFFFSTFHNLVLLIFAVYKTVVRLKRVANCDQHEQMKIYEKIADEFIEVSTLLKQHVFYF